VVNKLIFFCVTLSNHVQILFLQLIGWVIAAPFILAVLYTVLHPCFKYLVQKLKPRPSSPMKQLHPRDDLKIKIRDV